LVKIYVPTCGLEDTKLLNALDDAKVNPVLDVADQLLGSNQERSEPIHIAIIRSNASYSIQVWKEEDQAEHFPRATHSCRIKPNWRAQFRVRDPQRQPHEPETQPDAKRAFDTIEQGQEATTKRGPSRYRDVSAAEMLSASQHRRASMLVDSGFPATSGVSGQIAETLTTAAISQQQPDGSSLSGNTGKNRF
jgi:hypothetical protein